MSSFWIFTDNYSHNFSPRQLRRSINLLTISMTSEAYKYSTIAMNSNRKGNKERVHDKETLMTNKLMMQWIFNEGFRGGQSPFNTRKVLCILYNWIQVYRRHWNVNTNSRFTCVVFLSAAYNLLLQKRTKSYSRPVVTAWTV